MFEELINKKGFSLDRLATLCDVVDKGSIQEATRNNATRQGQYSRQIKELEKFLGFKVLDRSSRPSTITQAGKEISNLSRSFLTSIESYIHEKKNEQRTIMFGAGEGIIQWELIPNVLPLLKKNIPNTNFLFKNRQSKDIIEGVQNGKFDFGVVRKSAVNEITSSLNKPKVLSTDRLKFKYKLFIPKKLAKRLTTPLTIKKLSTLPFSILEGPGELRNMIDNLAHENKVSITPLIECSSSNQIWNLILRGEACGFLPEFVSNDQFSNRAEGFNLTGLNYRRDLCIIWNKDNAEMLEKIPQALVTLKNIYS